MYVGFFILFIFASPSSKNQKVIFLSNKIRPKKEKKKKKEQIQKHLEIIKMLTSH
jgi:hypothetical protein